MKKLLSVLLLLAFAGSAGAQVITDPPVGIFSGGPASGCTSSLIYATASSGIGCDPGAVVNGSLTTAGRSILTIRDTMSGTDSNNNFFNLTATLPTVNTQSANAMRLNVTGSGSSSTDQRAITVIMSGGYTGSSATHLWFGQNLSAGTGANLTSFLGNFGASLFVNSSTAGYNVGVYGSATGSSTYNYGVAGGVPNSGTGVRVGVAGFAGSGAGTRVGVYGGLDDASPSIDIYTASLFDNKAAAAPVLVARDNGAALPATGATATWSILDGANAQCGNCVLTSATMTAETQANLKESTHSYTWTNAQVVALGAATTGDITVATLPAKTQVLDAMVVITGAAVGPATVTVSCGDAIAGAPFINYVVASDAKAAANTVYGDAVAERGTSIDTEFWYLPSYTATTLVTCRFISSGANLDTVTGSTGRVILTTRLIP